MFKLLQLLGMVSLSVSAFSADASAPSTASQLSQVLGGLLLIVVLIVALSWVAKKFSQGGFQHNSYLKIVAALPLGTRERLMIIDAGGKQILLGVTATNIQTLHVFEEPIQIESGFQPESEFSKKLMSILNAKTSSVESKLNSADKPLP